MTPGVTMTVWRRRPQGGGSGWPFRETRPRGPPPRLSTPCPLVRPLLHPAVGPRARRAPRRAVDVAGGRGARQLAGRTAVLLPRGRRRCQERSLLVASTGAIGLPVLPSRADLLPPPRGERLGGAPARGAPTAEGRRGHVAPAWLQPSREGGRLASGPHRRERLVTPAQSAFVVPPAGSREAPWAFRHIFGARGLGAEGGTALSRVRRHGAPLPAPVPLAPRPRFQRNEATPGSWISPEGPRAP